jgi:sulfite exporter TauE/SafE/copper chaperone CopZ
LYLHNFNTFVYYYRINNEVRRLRYLIAAYAAVIALGAICMGNAGLLTKTLHIEGMTCVNCQNKIERKLRTTAGIEQAEVSYNRGTAVVSYHAETITVQEITSIIEALDYRVRSGEKAAGDGTPMDMKPIGLLVTIVALFIIIKNFGLIEVFNAFPLVESGMGYGMLFLIGIVTSVHCLAMCGGINLSQCIPQGADSTGERGAALRPSLLYNLGRVIAYTVVGVIVGALGRVFSFSGWMKGLIQLAAGVFMIIMGINMLGIFPWLRKFTIRMPKVFAQKIEGEKSRSNSPLYVGLLNGLMPCGPLQAMQLYALSTGDPLKGGLAMLLFSLGTVPLMFGLGALSSVLSRKFTARVMTAGAALVVILGMSMFSYGWNLSGFGSPLGTLMSGFAGGGSAAQGGDGTVIQNGVQVVNTSLSSGRYQPITVQAGIPVRWTIDAPQGSINGCNGRMFIPEYGIEHTFTVGSNVVEFTPTKAGVFRYSCWMGMIRSTITVVTDGAASAPPSADADFGYDEWDNITEPVPAGFRIPTGELAIAVPGAADSGEQIQLVAIELSDRGFSPAAVIVQAGIETEWVINNSSTREENFALRFPVYGQELPFDSGENIVYLLPDEDFEFFTADSEYYGYVKVVDDLAAMDIEAIKREIGGYETMIYPSAYFQPMGW